MCSTPFPSHSEALSASRQLAAATSVAPICRGKCHFVCGKCFFKENHADVMRIMLARSTFSRRTWCPLKSGKIFTRSHVSLQSNQKLVRGVSRGRSDNVNARENTCVSIPAFPHVLPPPLFFPPPASVCRGNN